MKKKYAKFYKFLDFSSSCSMVLTILSFISVVAALSVTLYFKDDILDSPYMCVYYITQGFTALTALSWVISYGCDKIDDYLVKKAEKERKNEEVH